MHLNSFVLISLTLKGGGIGQKKIALADWQYTCQTGLLGGYIKACHAVKLEEKRKCNSNM